ncbi:dormancy-associated protein 1-like isoform X1 [Musa acuminata AAA Group]|uniref:(wild Malaysian banana) hypothetical protein n=1 Tax=Musa acuminata subsp. malaccensis TaxID=214687 RepID=A0A804JQI3_MUSAM|nr:unnamed protein product [Musa acuminata subsp. malaccensis]
MVLLDKMWDDVLAGPPPERGLGKLRKVSTKPLNVKEGESSGGMYQRSMSMPQTPTTPVTPTSANAHTPRHDVWRSVFNPGSNAATKSLGADLFDKPKPNSPTVYDWYQIVSYHYTYPSLYYTLFMSWFLLPRALFLLCRLYSGETKSTHR